MTGRCCREKELRKIKTKHKVKDRSIETAGKFTNGNKLLLFITN